MKTLEQVIQESTNVESNVVSELAQKYLSSVGGRGGPGGYLQYTQNIGDSGPHPGPYSESVGIY